MMGYFLEDEFGSNSTLNGMCIWESMSKLHVLHCAQIFKGISSIYQ